MVIIQKQAEKLNRDRFFSVAYDKNDGETFKVSPSRYKMFKEEV